jgi:hypothetical protein
MPNIDISPDIRDSAGNFLKPGNTYTFTKDAETQTYKLNSIYQRDQIPGQDKQPLIYKLDTLNGPIEDVEPADFEGVVITLVSSGGRRRRTHKKRSHKHKRRSHKHKKRTNKRKY